MRSIHALPRPAGDRRAAGWPAERPAVPPLVAAVEAVGRTLAVVAELVGDGELPMLPVGDLLEFTRALHAIADTARAVAVAATAVVDERDAARGAGCTSTAHWLTRQAGHSMGAASATVGVGHALVGYPATRTAWLAGEVSEASVREITSGVQRALRALPAERAAAQRARCEEVLLHVARTRTPVDVRRAAGRLRVEADPEGAAAAAEAALGSQYLSFTPVPDGVEVRGFLATEPAAALITALDRIVDDLHRSGTLAIEQRAAEDAGLPARRRATRAALHARALGELCGRALADGALGSRHGQRPHVTYTVHHDELTTGLGGRIGVPGIGPVALPTATLERVLCDAEVHPVLTGTGPSGEGPPVPVRPVAVPPVLLDAFRASGQPADPVPPLHDLLDDDTLETFGRRLTGDRGRHVLDLGRTFRTAPPDLRRALEVRDGGCVMPGCLVDPSRCEAHHVVYWRHGGTTSLRDMALVCASHHHDLHEGGWGLVADPDRDPGDPERWIVHPPAPRLVAG